MNFFYILKLILAIHLLSTQTIGLPLDEIRNSSSLDGRIVGGIETTIQLFPHQVSLQRNGHHFCGASVIHAQIVLTAAHCIHQKNSQDIVVRAGTTDLYKGGNLYKVRNIISHEDYNKPTNFNNDIALLILQEPIALSQLTKTIPLMTQTDTLSLKSILFVSGWGTTSAFFVQASQRLRYTMVNQIDQAKCRASYTGATQVTTTMICAGAERGGRDSCQGDSGGPLIATVQGKRKQVGIVSWGISCANAAYPGVYTRVADYENWIRRQVWSEGNFEL